MLDGAFDGTGSFMGLHGTGGLVRLFMEVKTSWSMRLCEALHGG